MQRNLCQRHGPTITKTCDFNVARRTRQQLPPQVAVPCPRCNVCVPEDASFWDWYLADRSSYRQGTIKSDKFSVSHTPCGCWHSTPYVPARASGGGCRRLLCGRSGDIRPHTFKTGRVATLPPFPGSVGILRRTARPGRAPRARYQRVCRLWSLLRTACGRVSSSASTRTR